MNKQEEKKKKEKKVEEQEVEVEQQEENSQLEKLKEQIETCESQYKRALADYANLEKRTRDERSEWIRSASRDLLLRMLPVFDTLRLASKHSDDQGIKVTFQQFADVLKSEGVVKIETVGKKFDPHIMEAVEMVEDPSAGSEDGSGQEADDVVEEVREGYMLYDKLLRPAQVRVGKKAAS